MIIVFTSKAKAADKKAVQKKLDDANLKYQMLSGQKHDVIVVTSEKIDIDQDAIQAVSGVDHVAHIADPYKLVSRQSKPEGTVIKINKVEIGGPRIVIMAGPCSIESEKQLETIAKQVKEAGAQILRGGAFKWRTSPHSFQGLGLEGLKIMKAIGQKYNLLTACEVLDPRQVEAVAQYCDIIQIGTVSMQNYPLLREIGKAHKPAILKRGKWATYSEFLLAAEYILNEGNEKLILCERGIRTFVNETRHTMDINAFPYLKEKTHLPIIADPSHATGVRSLVPAVAKASIAAGADGLLLETHYDPANAATDAAQTISTQTFATLVKQVARVAKAVDRSI